MRGRRIIESGQLICLAGCTISVALGYFVVSKMKSPLAVDHPMSKSTAPTCTQEMMSSFLVGVQRCMGTPESRGQGSPVHIASWSFGLLCHWIATP